MATIVSPLSLGDRLSNLSNRQDLIDARLKQIENRLQARSVVSVTAMNPPPVTISEPKPESLSGGVKAAPKTGQKPGQPATRAGTATTLPKSTPKAEEIPIDISRIDFRVGKILSVERHPQADHLFVEQIDIGNPNPVQVCSGLAKFIPIEEMKDRLLVVIANMKPTNFRGVKSEAMVLAAASDDGNKVELVDPPKNSLPGTRISVVGFDGTPETQLNPKLKIFETVKPDLRSNGDLTACYKGIPLRTSEGNCTVKSLSNSQLG
jgi:methionine--tRNA ligase beta chain